MKIKTNLRAGAKSGTVVKGKSSSTDSVDSSSSYYYPPVVTTTRCAGL